MKKLFKILAVMMASVFICLCFGGCQMIDNAKKSHFIRISDDKIKFKEAEFIKLPSCSFFAPISNGDNVYVTASDVPVLLSKFFSENYLRSSDGVFVFGYYYERDLNTVYCRSDKYDEALQIIEQGFKRTGYGYSYYDFKKGKLDFYKLTEQQAAAIDNVISKVEPESLPDVATLGVNLITPIEEFSGNINFKKEVVDIGFENGRYYLIEYLDNSRNIYTVPDNLAGVFDDICEKLSPGANEITIKD